jgi:hypothetical protein
MTPIKNPLKKILELTQPHWDHPACPTSCGRTFIMC